MCAFVDCSLHDVAGVSNAFSVNGSGYFSSASIFGESTATVDLWATINYEFAYIEARERATGIRSSSDAPAITRPSIRLACGCRVPGHARRGIESAAFKEEHPREFHRPRRDARGWARRRPENRESERNRTWYLPRLRTSRLLLGRVSPEVELLGPNAVLQRRHPKNESPSRRLSPRRIIRGHLMDSEHKSGLSL